MEDEDIYDSRLIPSVEALRDKCIAILNDCNAWNEQKPIEGLHRYTNSLRAELHFVEKVQQKYSRNANKFDLFINKCSHIYTSIVIR